jgi:Putative Actinobacterial Holin-X, holin superfamily III
MERHWALLLTAGVAIVLAVVVGVLAVPRLRKSFESFQRSREELARNVAWIKTVLTYSGRSAPSQRRRV